jgi:hypothetical protein
MIDFEPKLISDIAAPQEPEGPDMDANTVAEYWENMARATRMPIMREIAAAARALAEGKQQ